MPPGRAKHSRAAIGRYEHHGQALVSGALDRVAGPGRIGVDEGGLQAPLHLKELGVMWVLSRNLGNVPSDPLMKGLGCNIRAIGPNDGA